MDSNIVLELKDVSRKRGTRRAVDHCGLTLHKGEIVGLVGPNGCGKTTLIKLILGQLRPDEGEVLVCGFNINEEFTKAIRQVGAVVENAGLYPYLTGYDHLKMLRRLNPSISKEREAEVLEMMGLTHELHHKISTYSIGQKEKLAIALSVLQEPALLLLDEPINGLDPVGIKEMRELIKKLAASGMCVLLSSHILAEMDVLCSRIVIMKAGRFVADLSARDLMDPHRIQVRFWVGQPELAREVIEATLDDADIVQNGDEIIVTGENLQVQQLNRLLVFQDIDVYSIRSQNESLEDSYIELMKEEDDD